MAYPLLRLKDYLDGIAPSKGGLGVTEASTQRIVPFYADELIAVQQPDGNIFVHFGRLCENLGLSRTAQVRRVQRHAVLTSGLTTIEVQTEGGAQTVQCLRIDLLPLWMAGLHASRVKDDVRPKLVHYQQEAVVVLWQAFKPQIMTEETSVVAADSVAIQQIQQIIDMGYAIARMGEQQLEIQRQQQALVSRWDSAARIIRDVHATSARGRAPGVSRSGCSRARRLARTSRQPRSPIG